MAQLRKATLHDIDNIMAFIDEHWKKDYILGMDREFFSWQFVRNEEVHFLLAEENDTLVGIQGYIPYNFSDNPDIAGSILKVLKTKNPCLGLEIVDRLCEFTNQRYVSSPGMSTRSVKLERLKGNEIPKMNHNYFLNPRIKEFKIARIEEKVDLSYKKLKRYTYELISIWDDFVCDFNQKMLDGYVPRKDLEYLKWRYFEHPVFKYDVIALCENEKRIAYFIVREIEINNRKMAKIVDYLGDNNVLENVGECLSQFIQEKEYEYLDFYNYGIDQNMLRKAGFQIVEKEDRNIIPNYFEPFVQENIEIYFSKPNADNFRLFIGDGDQDRPSKPRK